MFIDVEAVVREFLQSRLEVPVRTRVPDTRPATFVRVWRTGGAAPIRVLDRPMVTVQAWAATAPDASALAGRCRDLLFGASTSIPQVRRVEEVTGPYYDPDPDLDVGGERYTFTHQFNVRANF